MYVNYGGSTLDVAKKTELQPFAQKTGATMGTDSPSDPAKVKAMVQAGNVTWDLIDMDGASGAALCQGGMLRTRAEMGIDVSQVDPKYITDKCGVPIILTTMALVYNKAKYGDHPPTKITDFLDTKNFPGKRSTFNYAFEGLEAFELASGSTKLYPYNFAQIQSAYNKIKKNLVLQSTLAQQGEALSSGNFDMCLCLTGRAAVTPGVSPDKVGIVWDHAWVAQDDLYALKGSKAPKVQAAFMNYIAHPGPQEAFAAVQPYGSTIKGAKPKVKESLKYWMPEYNTDKTNGLTYIDVRYLAKPGVSEEANQKWTALTSG